MRYLFCFVILFVHFTSIAQELVENGGAEQPLWVGWRQVNTADTWSPAAQRAPHSGSYHFYPQNTSTNTSELYQNIDVSGSAAAIDAGTVSFTFSGWRRGFNNVSPFSGDQDRAQIIVEYRDASGTVLSFYDTGSAVFNTWTNNTDTRYPPAGTRSIRIRLISVRVSGSDNDGYYDDISLIQNNPCAPPTSISLLPNTTSHYCLGSSFTIAGVATPVNSNYYYTWYKNGSPITTASKTYTPISKTTSVASDAGTYTLRVEDGNTGTATCYKESSVTIVLDPPPVAGTISSNSETCNNTIPAPFTGTASTGGTAAKYYKWQRSTGSAAGPWVDVQAFNTTATGYAPTTSVILLAYYRRIDSSGSCANVATNVITIKTKSHSILDPITSLVRDTLCIGENFQLIPHLNMPPVISFNGGFYYTWKKVQGATTTTVASASTPLSTYPSTPHAATLADSGTYYLISQDGPTATQCKDSIKIIIRINQAPTKKALIQSNQELCLNDAASQLTESSAPTGAVGSPVYHQWYTTTDTTGSPVLSKIPTSSTGVSYNPGILSATSYFVRTDSVKYCAAVKTNFLKIQVNNKPDLDSIRATVNDTLCENFGDQFQLKGYVDSLTAGKQSFNGGFYFTWKKIQQPAAIPVTVSATGKYKDYPAVSRPVVEADSGTYYLIVQDGKNAKKCLDSIAFKMVVFKTCVATSCTKPDFISIKVASPGNTTLCSGSALTLQKDVVTLPATPPAFGYTYSWVRTNTLGSVVVQGPSTTYQDLIINSVSQVDSGRYHLIVKDGSGTPSSCAENSSPISIVVYKPVTPADIGNDTIVCIGNAVLPFKEITAPTGGSGSYTYQWQSSDDSFTFTDINGQTNTTYQSPNIFSTKYFRRIDKSGTCAAISSDTIRILTTSGVHPGNIISNDFSVCYNTAPGMFFASMTTYGGTGGPASITYQWQQSTDNTNWSDISGQILPYCIASDPITTKTYYRRRDAMGPAQCDTAYTESLEVSIYPTLNTGSIGSDQTICSGTSALIEETIPASGYNVIYQWVESHNKGASWEISLAHWTIETLETPLLTDTMWYKRVAFTLCEHDSSNVVKINIDPFISQPHVSINDALTCQSTSIQLTATASNAGTTPTYTWEKASSESGPWTTILNANTANYLINNPQPIDSGTVYKVTVTSSDQCTTGPDDTTVVLRVQKNLYPAVSIQANPGGTVCDTLNSITYTALSTDGGSLPTYQWYNGNTNTMLPGANGTTYTSYSPSDGDNVFVVMTLNSVTNCTNSGSATSPAFVLHTLPTPNPAITAIDTSICTPSDFMLYATTSNTTTNTFQWYKDNNPIPGATNKTYRVTPADTPGGIYTFKESNTACSFTATNNAAIAILESPVVSAGTDETVLKNTSITLQGNVAGSSNYYWTPSAGLSNPNILTPDVTIKNTSTYILTAFDPTGLCKSTSSVTIWVKSPIVIPNVITPNGDGQNDTWVIEHIEDYPEATFTVYNRWGNIVWKASNNLFQWNGTNYRNGELLADGTYFYIIDLKSNAYEPYTGYVQIIK